MHELPARPREPAPPRASAPGSGLAIGLRLAVLLAAASCAAGSGPPAPALERPMPAPSPALLPPEEPALAAFDGVGRWVSPACEPRPFERVLDVRQGGRFRLEDRVSPCPPDVECVWSGIQVVEGRARVTGATLVLEPETDPGPVRFAERLVLSRRGERAFLLGDVCPLELEIEPAQPSDPAGGRPGP